MEELSWSEVRNWAKDRASLEKKREKKKMANAKVDVSKYFKQPQAAEPQVTHSEVVKLPDAIPPLAVPEPQAKSQNIDRVAPTKVTLNVNIAPYTNMMIEIPEGLNLEENLGLQGQIENAFKLIGIVEQFKGGIEGEVKEQIAAAKPAQVSHIFVPTDIQAQIPGGTLEDLRAKKAKYPGSKMPDFSFKNQTHNAVAYENTSKETGLQYLKWYPAKQNEVRR